ncbi:hypothetical protein ABT001_29365 [Streptomyces sp. NPDC002793]|uniref:hypothetical protein n=1 Tax=Streptomyces sp. NPDC002793 TaxID=3154432 RepID=UPI00332BB9A7
MPAKAELRVEPPGGVFTEPEQDQETTSLLITLGQRGDAHSSRWSWVVVGRIRVPRTGPGRPRRPTGQGSRRQGIRLPREPRLSAQARHRRPPKPDTAYYNDSL